MSVAAMRHYRTLSYLLRASEYGYWARVGRCGKDVFCPDSLGFDDVCDDENRAAPQVGARPKGCGIESALFKFDHWRASFRSCHMIPTMESDETPRDLAARAITLRVSLRQTPHVQGEA
jgi:hypothetical protein